MTSLSDIYGAQGHSDVSRQRVALPTDGLAVFFDELAVAFGTPPVAPTVDDKSIKRAELTIDVGSGRRPRGGIVHLATAG
ncbi:MAG TPA: hypothetical protein VFU93_06675 [Acidimicrobiales bacterium]|nr:hypothetical protein [Acidimicrobiales bacterium]